MYRCGDLLEKLDSRGWDLSWRVSCSDWLQRLPSPRKEAGDVDDYATWLASSLSVSTSPRRWFLAKAYACVEACMKEYGIDPCHVAVLLCAVAENPGSLMSVYRYFGLLSLKSATPNPNTSPNPSPSPNSTPKPNPKPNPLVVKTQYTPVQMSKMTPSEQRREFLRLVAAYMTGGGGAAGGDAEVNTEANARAAAEEEEEAAAAAMAKRLRPLFFLNHLYSCLIPPLAAKAGGGGHGHHPPPAVR